MINDFRGEHFFLSNFYQAPITYDGLNYGSTEAAFQAQKTTDMNERVRFQFMTPAEAKRAGRKLKLRPDWDEIKDRVMYEVCKEKFTMHKELRNKLLDTEFEDLVEGNTWNDTYWGVCDGVGENKLGKILMQIRKEIQMQLIEWYANDVVKPMIMKDFEKREGLWGNVDGQ